MDRAKEKSQLKRGRPSVGEGEQDYKKPRRSSRIQSHTEVEKASAPYLPSPLTHQASSTTEKYKESTKTPPTARDSHHRQQTPASSPPLSGISSPPLDTQPLSQFIYPPKSLSYEVEDEEAEGVWGYLLPLRSGIGKTMILKKRTACPNPAADCKSSDPPTKKIGAIPERDRLTVEEERYEDSKQKGVTSGGYLIGRHPECDRVLDIATVSNRHCLIFPENAHGDTVAVVEDLSSNGTKVNEEIVGRNKRRELQDGDEITILEEAQFMFRYPQNQKTSAFGQQYTLLEKLGKGHFATVHLCLEKSTGQRYAVKIFTKRPGIEERSKTEGLQQEIAVLMGVSHPNMLCLKDTFDEKDAVYLVLELAAEGELFNWIVMKQKLTEAETRKVFIQLFKGVKYLHERNIVHRDIKPENILLVDRDLTVKLADFGLAKIIGEESFTTTLCGTPSYVAPEILQNSKHRKYTRAVDVWSLGVVLYICLCGFPPFSDELTTPQNPLNLSQQITAGRFDFPSPYWDSVDDSALDLIDRMLTVDVEKRIKIDECLQHPWLIGSFSENGDSFDGLTGAMNQLDFSKRKAHRERTLLSEINDIRVSKVIDREKDKLPVLVFDKNGNTKDANSKKANGAKAKEQSPSAGRDPREFMELGGKGDEELFGYDGESRYA